MSAHHYSQRIKDAAAVLTLLIDEPAYAGHRWTWMTVGDALGLTIKDAKLVIYYLRETAANVSWSIGTHGSGWTFKPSTGLDAETLDGWINQYKHLLTRHETAAHAFGVLASVDPEPAEARFSREQAKLHGRIAVDLTDAISAMSAYRTGGLL